jgi:hypothetical protein
VSGGRNGGCENPSVLPQTLCKELGPDGSDVCLQPTHKLCVVEQQYRHPLLSHWCLLEYSCNNFRVKPIIYNYMTTLRAAAHAYLSSWVRVSQSIESRRLFFFFLFLTCSDMASLTWNLGQPAHTYWQMMSQTSLLPLPPHIAHRSSE